MSNDITGTLVVPPAVAGFTAFCTALVRDITHSDSPVVEPVASTRWQLTYQPGVPPDFTVAGIPDAVLDAVEDGTTALNLEVHVDLDGSGAFSVGDLATLKAYPVTRATATTPIAVELTQL